MTIDSLRTTIASGLKGIFWMPFDAMLMSAVVLVIFIVFAGVIAWADKQTRPERLNKR
jgi:hypothetical protein